MELIRAKKSKLSIDLAPLIDVVFQLLVFFMLTSTFASPAIKMILPKAVSQEMSSHQNIVVSIDQDKSLYINNQKTNIDSFQLDLSKIITVQRKSSIHIRGDQDMSYKYFVQIIDLARRAGATQINIVHQKRTNAMKWQFSYNTNLFVPIFVFSLAAHVVLINTGKFVASPVQYSTIEAPNSVEITIVEEQIIAHVEVIMVEEILTTKQSQEMLPKVKELEKVEQNVREELKNPKIKSSESQGAISKAKPLSHLNPAPLYPHSAKRRGWQGKVFLKVFVEKDGTPRKIEVLDSSGFKILDEAAMKTVNTWRFEPAKSKVGDISTWVVIPIHFKLSAR